MVRVGVRVRVRVRVKRVHLGREEVRVSKLVSQ